jgi:hypothetical protein
MKKTGLLIGIFICLLLTGCSRLLVSTVSPGTEAIIETESVTPVEETNFEPQPVLYGIWINDQNEVLVVSESSLYMVEIDTAAAPQVRETYYEIQSIDWAKDTITMNMKWVRVNGSYGGFDMPLHYMKVSINDEVQLMYGMGDEGQGIPDIVDVGPFFKK